MIRLCVGWDGMRLTLFNTKVIGQRLHHELLQWITQIKASMKLDLGKAERLEMKVRLI